MSSGKKKAGKAVRQPLRKSGSLPKFLYLLVAAAAILVLSIIISVANNKESVPEWANSRATDNSANDFRQDGELYFLSDDGTEISRIEIELADTPTKTTLGLMFRDRLEADQGMLFIFQDPGPRSFWMKNTILSLDMIFADAEGKIVTIHSRTVPYSEEPYISINPAQYVVEVNAGYVERHNIQLGDKISFKINSD